MDSLKGPFDEASLCRLDGNLDHTGIMASPELWDDITRCMMRLTIGSSDYVPQRPEPPAADVAAVDDTFEDFLMSVPLLPPRAPGAPPSGYGTFDPDLP